MKKSVYPAANDACKPSHPLFLKKLLCLLLAFGLCFSLSSCGLFSFMMTSSKQAPIPEVQPEEPSVDPSVTNVDENGTTYQKEFGTYTVPTGWVENAKHSTADKFFYVKEGTEDMATPNNISINAGTNQYAADDHMSFRYAILNQLGTQLPKDTTLNANGSSTANGDILYTFQFTTNENGQEMTGTQYYIVGDYQYIMVYETVFGSSEDTAAEETDAVAKAIVDSFQWAD